MVLACGLRLGKHHKTAPSDKAAQKVGKTQLKLATEMVSSLKLCHGKADKVSLAIDVLM